MSKLRWKLRYYWRKLVRPDGVYRGDPSKLPTTVPGVEVFYAGEPGDPGSDTPIAYRRV